MQALCQTITNALIVIKLSTLQNSIIKRLAERVTNVSPFTTRFERTTGSVPRNVMTLGGTNTVEENTNGQ